MPTSTFTQTGRDELRASILQLPDRVTRACRLVALSTANGILVDARRRLLSQTKGEGNTAAALQVTEDAANKQFLVHYGLIRNRPANLPIWLEYGTVKMTARPHMRPAAEAARARYDVDMQRATEGVARDLFEAA